MRIVAVLAMAMAASAAAAEIPRAVVVLESGTAPLPGQVAEAAPPRFVLLEDGQVFVGGTHGLFTTRLAGRELKDLDRRLSEIRKLPSLAGVVTVGPGKAVRHLLLRKGRPLDMTIEGDLAAPISRSGRPAPPRRRSARETRNTWSPCVRCSPGRSRDQGPPPLPVVL
jgi:hypothetical protein